MFLIINKLEVSIYFTFSSTSVTLSSVQVTVNTFFFYVYIYLKSAMSYLFFFFWSSTNTIELNWIYSIFYKLQWGERAPCSVGNSDRASSTNLEAGSAPQPNPRDHHVKTQSNHLHYWRAPRQDLINRSNVIYNCIE